MAGYHYTIMKKAIVLLSLKFFILTSSLVLAQEPKFINVYKDWYVFTLKQENLNICYLSSVAAKSEGNYTKRGDVLFVVTLRPAEKEFGIVNFRTGYKFKKNSAAVLTINKKKFSLFTQGSDGWAKDNETDKAITQAMILGAQMVIVGTSSRGTKTTDTFSLSGFTAAYKAASKACKNK